MHTIKQEEFAKDVKQALLRHPDYTTVRELAHGIGFHPNTVSRAIHNRKFPRVLKRICRVLSLPLP